LPNPSPASGTNSVATSTTGTAGRAGAVAPNAVVTAQPTKAKKVSQGRQYAGRLPDRWAFIPVKQLMG